MFIKLLSFLVILHCCFAPPVTKEKKEDEKDSDEGGLENYMEYHRYLKEIVHALESDPDFRQKLEKANESDIRSGKIAFELEFVSHHVRTRLDEIKRRELVRLKELKERQLHMNDEERLELPSHKHLNHKNPHTFEVEDLMKLIAKSTEDLAEADRRRKEEFKRYEMQKEYEKQERLNHTTGDERQKLEKEFKEREEQFKKHEPLHEPGHKKQLEEVWEEQDHMDQQFDPKTFFIVHDLDSNGFLDQNEVKALFIKELDKKYKNQTSEEDQVKRAEELELMREAVFQEVDVNRDGLIDYEEFMMQTRRQTFEQDRGWQGLDDQKIYTDEELQMYIQQQEAMHRNQGYQQHHGVPPQHYQQPPQYHAGQGQAPPQYNAQQPQGYQHPPQGYQQPPPQYSQGQHQQQQQSAQYNTGEVPGKPQVNGGQGGHAQGPPQPGQPQGHPQQNMQGQNQHYQNAGGQNPQVQHQQQQQQQGYDNRPQGGNGMDKPNKQPHDQIKQQPAYNHF